MSDAMYNVLAIFCIIGCIGILIGCWFAFEAEIAKKADIKAEKHRAELRRDPSSQLKYRAEYWVRRNRENLWEELEEDMIHHVK